MGLFNNASQLSREELERREKQRQRDLNAEGLGYLLAFIVLVIVVYALLFSGENVQPGGRFYFE